ncbi:hypothetical protein DF3PB_10046 [uncultured Defluviicoccus sp.]|uniref:Uncharacterized protein n=1 Tax=metagenome TaxID=256318 RepID=A0A380T7E5_9ZZZZ|nr:hypothetical protein DF3PB_10046 [uncultured Defluviicoccus sp.]
MDSIRPLLARRSRGDVDLRKIQMMIEKALLAFRTGREFPSDRSTSKDFNRAARKFRSASSDLRGFIKDAHSTDVGQDVFRRLSQLTFRRFPLRILRDLVYFEEVLTRAIALEPSGGPEFDYPGHVLAYDLIHPYRALSGDEPFDRVRHRSKSGWYVGNAFATFVHEISEAHLQRLAELRTRREPSTTGVQLKRYLDRYRLNDGGAAVSWAVQWFKDLTRD